MINARIINDMKIKAFWVIDIQSSSEALSKPIMIINHKRRVASYTLIIIDKFFEDTFVIIK